MLSLSVRNDDCFRTDNTTERNPLCGGEAEPRCLSVVEESGPNRRPRDLYGIWKDGFPKDFDIDGALREIRGEWRREVEEIIS